MSKRRTTIAVLVATLVWNGPISLGGWTIMDPVGNSTFDADQDVDGMGACSSHPSSRNIYFGTNAGIEGKKEDVASQEMMPGGPFMWEVTLTPLSPATEWNLSPTDEFGMPIGDHRFWVYNTVTQSKDAETNGHVVVAP